MTRAGSMSPTGTSLTLSRRRPIPASMRPPVAVSAAMWASGITDPSAYPTTVSEPWITAIETADSRTPMPKVEAKAIAAKPSSTALSTSWSMPRPRPSESDPRIVSGPTQNSRLAVKNASLT